jgi:hypothetical protein
MGEEDSRSDPGNPPPPRNDNAKRAGGLAVGIAIGVAIGIAMKNLAFGIAIGVAIGVAFSAGGKKSNKP